MDMEDRRCWYQAAVLMADLTAHRYTMRGLCEEDIEARMRLVYPEALTILVRPESDEGLQPSNSPAGDPDYLLVASSPLGLPR